MLKKIGLVFMALVMLLFPVTQILEQSKAYAIGTKVATKVATEAVKEVIKDSAKEKAFQMALDEVGKIYDSNNKYVFKEGYEGYCVEVKKPDGSCDKPIQIKKDITEADQKKLDDSVGKKLDQKIGGQIYNTKWGKYLDYVVPIYAVSAAGAAVDYAVNGEDSILGMMNEVAMEALEDSGIIQPVETLSPVLVDENGERVSQPGEGDAAWKEPIRYDLTMNNTQVVQIEDRAPIDLYMRNNGTGTIASLMGAYVANPYKDRYTLVAERSEKVVSVKTDESYRMSGAYIGHPTAGTRSIGGHAFEWHNRGTFSVAGETGVHTITKNGEIIGSYESGQNTSNRIYFRSETDTSNYTSVLGYFSGKNANVTNTRVKKVTETVSTIEVFKPGELNRTYEMENGDVYKHKIKWETYGPEMLKDRRYLESVFPGNEVAVRFTLMERTRQSFIPFVPEWSEELVLMQTVPMDITIFRKDDDTIVLPPIASMEYTGLSGEPLNIVKNPETGETSFTYQDGSPVNEDSVNVAPGTGYTKTPEGFTYTPTNPTPENPNREPENVVVNPPKTETPTDPNSPPAGTPPGTGTDEPPLEPFPEGKRCEEGLKFPIFSPLKEQFSTSFPFSIPWDIGRAIEAGFGDIGTEKPEYEMKLKFAGKEETIKITTPKIFDDWKPFTDSLLLFTFDVLIMFGVYRFVKGAGS